MNSLKKNKLNKEKLQRKTHSKNTKSKKAPFESENWKENSKEIEKYHKYINEERKKL